MAATIAIYINHLYIQRHLVADQKNILGSADHFEKLMGIVLQRRMPIYH